MSSSRTAGPKHFLRAMAFLTRSIRQDSRLLSHHVLRAAMPALILYIFFLQLELATRRAAAGGSFAGWVVDCCYWFLTLFGGLHFSTAIVEEKEDDTLPLLQMTGVSPVAILLGKSLPRLAVALLFLIVAVPFLTLALTLGGVLPLGLITAMVSLMVYAVMLSQMGLLASVLTANATRAFMLLALFWLVVELSSFWAWALDVNDQTLTFSLVGIAWIDGLFKFWNNTFARLSEFSLLLNLGQTTLSFTTIDTQQDQSVWRQFVSLCGQVWNFRMGAQLSIAVVFFLFSWICFRSARIQTLVAESRGLAGLKAALLRRRQFGSTTRVSGNALTWKSWQHLSGGRGGLIMRLIGMPILVIVGCGSLLTMLDIRPDLNDIAAFSFFIGVVIFAANAFLLFGSLVNVEIYQKTLPALIMLPQPTSRTLTRLTTGTLPAVFAGASTSVVSFVIILWDLIDRSPVRSDDVMEVVLQPWMWHVLSMITLNLILGLLLSTYFRYGGMLIAFGVILAAFFLGLFTVVAISFAGAAGGEDFIQYVVPTVLILCESGLCFMLWKRIIVRLEQLAAQ